MPASSEPIVRSRPSARAPSIVAISSTVRAGSTRGSPDCSLWRSAACRIASNMSRSLLLAAPSVPSPTCTRARPHRRRLARCRSRASCCSPDCARRRRPARRGCGCRRASRGRHGPRAYAATPGWPAARSRCVSRYRTGVALCCLRAIAISSRVSARWMMSGASCSLRGSLDRLQHRRVERVHRVRRKRWRDQIVAGELLDETRCRASSPSAGVFASATGNWMMVWPSTPRSPASRVAFGDLLLEVVHVGIRGRPRLDHLERGQPGADAHELRRHRLGFGGKDVLLEPLHQRQIVGEPAVEHHRRVRVRVDQARAGRPAPWRRSSPSRRTPPRSLQRCRPPRCHVRRSRPPPTGSPGPPRPSSRPSRSSRRATPGFLAP